MGALYIGGVLAWPTQKEISHPEYAHGGLGLNIRVHMGNGLGLE